MKWKRICEDVQMYYVFFSSFNCLFLCLLVFFEDLCSRIEFTAPRW